MADRESELESLKQIDQAGAVPSETQHSAPPSLTHTLHQAQSSVLSLAADERWIFSGSQGTDIFVWDRDTFRVVGTLKGHTASVLSLEVASDKKWLFSSSGDSTVRVWSTETLTPIYVLMSFIEYAAGDIFSLAYSPSLQTLFFGCQNTSLQWFDFSRDLPCDGTSTPVSESGAGTGALTPVGRKPHKFFDSFPQPAGRPVQPSIHHVLSPSVSSVSSSSSLGLSTTSQLSAPTTVEAPPSPQPKTQSHLCGGGTSCPVESNAITPTFITVPECNMISSAHFGYIYCMALVQHSQMEPAVKVTPPGVASSPKKGPETTETIELVTGSGDEDVKLWSYGYSEKSTSLTLLHTFFGGVGGVLSLISRSGTIYAGCQDGHVKVWDLDTKTLIRTIVVQEGVDILSLSLLDGDLYTSSASGWVHRFSSSFDCTTSWKAHKGITLSSIIVPTKRTSTNDAKDRFDLITGANDNDIKLWDITKPERRAGRDHQTPGGITKLLPGHTSDEQEAEETVDEEELTIEATDTMIYSLSQFVSFPSVSNSEAHQEDCRQAAIWLKRCLSQLGAESSSIVYGVEGKNPVVVGTFKGSESQTRKPRVLFYGHYDVIAAGSNAGWDTDPYTLTGLNGYLYGRGVTDNKGPVLAVACAASEMLAKRTLEIDLVVLVEGEEEAGSVGFAEAIRKHKDQIGHIDAILVSNSYWIDDVSPCITYGLRGVVHSTIEIASERPDLHSGVEGGGETEPMIDMVKLLGKLSEGTQISIPGFYDSVRAPSADEDESFNTLERVTGRSVESLASRWREPSLSIHSVHNSGPGNSTIIPAHVRAKVSLRIVPDQDLQTITVAFESYVNSTFKSLNSPNTLRFTVDRDADWWLGQLDDHWFKALEGAVKDEWGVEPLRIREGGSIPSIPFLEKEFKCHALHLPLGQSSDQAHLRNERISVKNLRKGKSVIERFFAQISQHPL